MNRARSERVALGALGVASVLVLYTITAAIVARPQVLPPPTTLVATVAALTRNAEAPATGGHQAGRDMQTGAHTSEQVRHLLAEGSMLPGALAISAARVLFGVGVGGLVGVGLGVAMGWSPAVGHYLHPVYVLLRSVPPIALITYVMLWLGHGEAHRLIPVAYAVLVTVVIPVWHGTRDIAGIHVRAARALGASGGLLFRRVLVPAITPSVLSGLRYALLIAWMTTIAVEMLMSEDGLGHVIVGGGLWSSRTAVGVDPAVVIVAILTVAAAGWLTDAAMRGLTRGVTTWAERER